MGQFDFLFGNRQMRQLKKVYEEKREQVSQQVAGQNPQQLAQQMAEKLSKRMSQPALRQEAQQSQSQTAQQSQSQTAQQSQSQTAQHSQRQTELRPNWFDPNAVDAPNLTHYYGDAMSYFRDIIYREFPEYQIREMVSVFDINPYYPRKTAPISFLFCKGQEMVLAIQLISGGRATIPEKQTIVALQKKNIPCLHFYTRMPNYDFYVRDRIRETLENA